MNVYGVCLAVLAVLFLALAALFLALSLKRKMFESATLLVVSTGALWVLTSLYLVFATRAGEWDCLEWLAVICLGFVAFSFVCLAIDVRDG